MKLTSHSYFSHYIFHPCSLPNPKERCLALSATIALSILSLGIIPLICAIARCLKNRNITDQTKNARHSTPLKVFQEKFPSLQGKLKISHSSFQSTTPPPSNIAELIKERLKKTGAPTNATEWFFHDGALSYGKEILTKEPGFQSPFLISEWKRCQDPFEAMTNASVSILFDAYFGNKAEAACLSPIDGTYLGKNKEPKIVYCPVRIAYYQSKTRKLAEYYVKNLLQAELAANPNHRPDKIFVPLFWSKQDLGHFTLLVIEPKAHPSRVTMINNNGDGITTYHDFENGAIAGAKKIYPDALYARNKIRLWATGNSCGHDVVDLARSLADVPNAQEVIVQEKWPCKTPEEDLQRRKEHAKKFAEFLHKYALSHLKMGC